MIKLQPVWAPNFEEFVKKLEENIETIVAVPDIENNIEKSRFVIRDVMWNCSNYGPLGHHYGIIFYEEEKHLTDP